MSNKNGAVKEGAVDLFFVKVFTHTGVYFTDTFSILSDSVDGSLVFSFLPWLH